MISHLRAVKTRGGPDFNISFFRCSSGSIKTGRHYADDQIHVRVHSHAPIQNVWIGGESSFPEAIANHNFPNESWRVIARIKTPTQLRLHSQQFKIIWCNAHQANSRRLFRSREIIFVKPRRRNVLENSRTLQILPFGLRHSDIASADAGKIILNGYQLFGVWIRQRLQKRGINDSKDGRCGSNTERDCDYGGLNENWRFLEFGRGGVLIVCINLYVKRWVD